MINFGNEAHYTGLDENEKAVEFGNSIIYNPNAEFEYFTMERCCCDGTLSFFNFLTDDIIHSLAKGETHNKKKEPDDNKNDLYAYDRIYEIGDFVFGEEHNERFATDDKPWMKSRFTVFLPIKMEFIKR